MRRDETTPDEVVTDETVRPGLRKSERHGGGVERSDYIEGERQRGRTMSEGWRQVVA